MLPRIVLHAATSLDGRVDGFPIDLAQFYHLAGTWKEDATLAGCDTILAGLEMNEQQPESDGDAGFESDTDGNTDTDSDGDSDGNGTSRSEDAEAAGERPLLVIPDSRGRMRRWAELLRYPYWRGGVALCSQATPIEYVEYLYASDIDCIVWGKDRVDLKKCLAELAERHDVKTVRVDSGGSLAQALLREGLVDEISLLIHPVIVGAASSRPSFFGGGEPDSGGTATKAAAAAAAEAAGATGTALNAPFPLSLRLLHLERLNEGLVWSRHVVIK